MSTEQAIMECMEEHHADAQEAATGALMHGMRISPGIVTQRQIEDMVRQAFIDGAVAERTNPMPAHKPEPGEIGHVDANGFRVTAILKNAGVK